MLNIRWFVSVSNSTTTGILLLRCFRGYLQHVGHALVRFRQQEEEAAGCLHERGCCVDVVPREVVQQALDGSMAFSETPSTVPR